MPFVSETGQVALPKKGYAAQLGIEENDPSIAEIAGAFWRQENIIAVSYTHLTLPTTPYV